MRKLIAIVVIAALGWSGWWFFGAAAVERVMTNALAARQAEGWVADYSDLKTRGFPNRFDTTITDLELADPATGLAWSAPMVQILALSYQPHHVILALPPDQVVGTPLGQVGVASSRMRGSLVVSPTPALTLDRATFVADDLVLTRGLDRFEIANGRLAIRPKAAAEGDNIYDIALEINDVSLAEAFAGAFPDMQAIAQIRVPTSVRFDAPLDRAAFTGRRPMPVAITVDKARMVWGGIELDADGDLTVDQAGTPEGQIDLTVRGWGELLDIFRSTGVIPPDQIGNLQSGLGFLAALSGGSGELKIPLIFTAGQMSLGPVPLGPAPRLGGAG